MRNFLCVTLLLSMHSLGYSLGKRSREGQIPEGAGSGYSHTANKMGSGYSNSRRGNSSTATPHSAQGSVRKFSWRNLFGGGSSGGSNSGLVTPFKANGFNGNPGTIYFDVDETNYCKAGTLYWYDKNNGWMGCRALNRATGYSVGAGRNLGTTHSGKMSDGTPCNYRYGGGGSRGSGETLPVGYSSSIYGTKTKSSWGPERAFMLNSLLRIHGRAGLGSSPTLSQLEKGGGASGCVVTSDSCLRSMNNSGTSQKAFRVQ